MTSKCVAYYFVKNIKKYLYIIALMVLYLFVQ